jgi:hypothetical protein
MLIKTTSDQQLPQYKAYIKFNLNQSRFFGYKSCNQTGDLMYLPCYAFLMHFNQITLKLKNIYYKLFSKCISRKSRVLQYRRVVYRVANARAAVTDMEKVACSIASPQGLIIWICNMIHNGGCYPATETGRGGLFSLSANACV